MLEFLPRPGDVRGVGPVEHVHTEGLVDLAPARKRGEISSFIVHHAWRRVRCDAHVMPSDESWYAPRRKSRPARRGSRTGQHGLCHRAARSGCPPSHAVDTARFVGMIVDFASMNCLPRMSIAIWSGGERRGERHAPDGADHHLPQRWRTAWRDLSIVDRRVVPLVGGVDVHGHRRRVVGRDRRSMFPFAVSSMRSIGVKPQGSSNLVTDSSMMSQTCRCWPSCRRQPLGHLEAKDVGSQRLLDAALDAVRPSVYLRQNAGTSPRSGSNVSSFSLACSEKWAAC